MEFSDKLQKIRKENNITQEGLADKLNVSRQAVSKWESGGAYPDTEKLIQISKIFNISLDELINDSESKNKDVVDKKISFMEILNDSLEFISKSVNMFWSMKFMEKIKCLFEMGVLFLIIILVAMFSDSVIINLIGRILMFLPENWIYNLCNLFDTLLLLVWVVLGGIIVVKIFKTRYLDYYVFITDDSVSEKTIEEPIKELKEKKEYKVVIRDPKDSNLNILKRIGNVFLWLFKCFCVLMLVPIVLLNICLIGMLVISLFYITYGLIFNGISIALIGSILFMFIIIEFIYNIIFNRNHSFTRIFRIFMISISLIGIGFGLSLADLSNFSMVSNDDYIKESKIISMKDNLLFDEINNINEENIIIDNNIDYIKVDISRLENVLVYMDEYTSSSCNDNDCYKYTNIMMYYDMNEFNYFKYMVNQMKDKKIIIDSDSWKIDKIYISKDNLTKLKDNYVKYNSDIYN